MQVESEKQELKGKIRPGDYQKVCVKANRVSKSRAGKRNVIKQDGAQKALCITVKAFESHAPGYVSGYVLKQLAVSIISNLVVSVKALFHQQHFLFPKE